MPVPRKSLRSSGIARVTAAAVMIAPSRNEPPRLTVAVPRGKSAPNTRAAQIETRYRAPLPSAPPAHTRRKRDTGTLVPRLGGRGNGEGLRLGPLVRLTPGGLPRAGRRPAPAAPRDPPACP